MIDTHTHLYDHAFDVDRDACIERDRAAGIEAIFLPAIDCAANEALWALCRRYPGYCYPLVGLHPTSVNENPDYMQELDQVEQLLAHPPVERFYGVGEIGLDLYWNKEWVAQQTEVFERQLDLALQYELPVVIHTRDAWDVMHTVLGRYAGRGLRGIMHAFAGSVEDYRRVKTYGDFLFGLGGPVTYKKSVLTDVVPHMSLHDIVLESDAPYLPPVPHRGKRNESSMMVYTCARVGELMGIDASQVALLTTANAKRIFSI